MAFDSAGLYPLIKKLRNGGHKVAVAEPRYPDFYNLLKQQLQPPEVFLCDHSTLPSHARESSNYIRGLKAYRETPFILFNVKPDDEAKAKEKVAGATILNDDAVEAALRKVLPGPPDAG